MTIAEARRELTNAFRLAGLDTPDLDARLLVGHALGLSHTALVVAAERALNDSESERIAAFAARRLEREPVARILGCKEFWGLHLQVTGATLVPRPETETVVEAALAAIDIAGDRTRSMRIADLGTGTGALLLALLSELPNAFGVGTDLNLQTLATARDNAERLGLSGRAGFVNCDFGSALAGAFDVIVSNPPYIASEDLPTLAPEVQRDAPLALDGGSDGLMCYRAIVGDAPRLLAADGCLIVELGVGQEEPVAALMRAEGLAPEPARHDLSGIPRALTARLLP